LTDLERSHDELRGAVITAGKRLRQLNCKGKTTRR